MSVFLCECSCAWGHSWRPEEDVRCPGAGVTGSSEPPHVGAGKQNPL